MVTPHEPTKNRPDDPGTLLFTPGPLTTSRAVKEAMLEDIGSWDRVCIELTAEIRERLVGLAAARTALVCTPMQGSGSFAVEAALGSAVPREGKLLVLANGAYGERMARMAQVAGIPHVVHRDPEDRPHDPRRVADLLDADPAITHVAFVHLETTTGLLHPLRELLAAVGAAGRRAIVDAISSFGGHPSGPGLEIDFDAGPLDHLVGSANKCLQGVPGFAFVLSRRDRIERCEGNARSLCLDLFDQWRCFETTGRFRYTPPTHVLRAFRRALDELDEEGGPAARARRYAANHRTLLEGMDELGFRPFVAEPHRSHVITAFGQPEGFDFDALYEGLHRRGLVIYPGKLTRAPTFRIATIGAITPAHVRRLLRAIAEVLGARVPRAAMER